MRSNDAFRRWLGRHSPVIKLMEVVPRAYCLAKPKADLAVLALPVEDVRGYMRAILPNRGWQVSAHCGDWLQPGAWACVVFGRSRQSEDPEWHAIPMPAVRLPTYSHNMEPGD